LASQSWVSIESSRSSSETSVRADTFEVGLGYGEEQLDAVKKAQREDMA
jgi:hypothetical protein